MIYKKVLLLMIKIGKKPENRTCLEEDYLERHLIMWLAYDKRF